MKNIITLAAALLFGLTAFCQKTTNTALDSLNNIKDPVALNKRLKALGSGSEEDLILLSGYYRNSAKSSDSVKKIVMKRFPKGRMALGYRLTEINAQTDAATQDKLLVQLKKEFPEAEYEQMNFTVAYGLANAKNVRALDYLPQLSGRTRMMALGTIPAMVLTFDLKAAEAAVVKELAVPNLPVEERMALLPAYSQILDKKGEHQQAFLLMKEYYGQSTRKSPMLTAKYNYMLSRTGAYTEAFPELEKAVLEGNADDEIKGELKVAYAKLNPEKDVEAYISGIDKQVDDRSKKELLAKMISKPAPQFTVTDLQGKQVSLNDFKGKTVVLDFWATWCGPCKRALPAMQMTVDKYKDDPNVKFLFIHTWEQVENPTADATKYFADNKYRLPLYMDLKDVKSKVNPAVSAFGVKGIPAKFVIDGEGNIRFEASGFGGTNEKAVAELSAMIELSRQRG